MSRWPRMVVPGVAVHVIQRGNNRQPIFFATDDYPRFRADLVITSQTYGCDIHAYVLMTNHVHLLLTPRCAGAVSRMMQALGPRYVRYINGTYRRSGTLWEGRFRSSLVGTDRYLLACSRYIELNPVRAGMVAGPSDYPYSSYAANAQGDVDALVVPQPAYLALASTPVARCEAYRLMFQETLPADTLTRLRSATEAGEVVGDSRFRAAIESVLARRVERDSHGGDRRSAKFRERAHDRDL